MNYSFKMIATAPSPSIRSADTRARLIDAALTLFGEDGFSATSTRSIAERAQVNLAAIPYHFGGKEGLYRAVAEHVVEAITQAMSGVVLPGRSDAALAPAEARAALQVILEHLAQVLLGSEDAARWSRFIVREHMAPSACYGLLYDGFMAPLHGHLSTLIARVRGEDEPTPETAVRAFTLIGQMLTFRIARTAFLMRMGYETLGPAELALIKRVLSQNLDAILSAGAQP